MKRRTDILFWIGAVFLSLLVLFIVFGPSVRHSPDAALGTPFQAPNATYWLGTDEQGRDIFARLAQGGRVSLGIALVVQGIALVVGLIVGVLGVYAPKWLSSILLRITDAMFAFPDILLAILIVGIYSASAEGLISMVAVIAALSVTAWPSLARLIRGQVATLKDREFVVASKAMGASTFFTVTRHVLPQLWGLLLAVVMIELAATVLAESTLSFLGIGVQKPNPSWGNMIDTARLNMTSHPQYLLWPCLLLSLTIFALNFVGDGLRAMADPKRER